jgi:hypothetical protein
MPIAGTETPLGALGRRKPYERNLKRKLTTLRLSRDCIIYGPPVVEAEQNNFLILSNCIVQKNIFVGGPKRYFNDNVS